MSPVLCLVVTLGLCGALTSAASADTTTKPQPDVKTAARQLVKDVRQIADQAKNGMYVKQLRQDVLDLQADAAALIQLLPGEVSECQANLVIKMAAAGTGSHAVLTVLLAEDKMSVLNGRLSVALAFLDHVAQQLEDELSLSTDISGHLTAVIFGTDVTASIVDSVDDTVKALTNEGRAYKHRVRRQSSSLDLGKGWSVGTDGVSWRSSSGRHRLNAKPTFSGLKPDGVKATYGWRSASGRASFDANARATFGSGRPNVNVGASFTFRF